MNKKIEYFFLSYFLFIGLIFQSQSAIHKVFNASGDVYGTRVFQENKGQWNDKPSKGYKVLYGMENGNELVYFTSHGLIYEHVIPREPISEEQEREEELKTSGQPHPEKELERRFVYMNWLGANSEIEVDASEKQSHYFTYCFSN